MQPKLSFVTLALLISFASVNAVLFTPGLPDIARFFTITDDVAQLTITWFLVGYTLGQLLYGPLTARFGSKPALYIGIMLQIISSLVCVAAGVFHLYWLLVLGRFTLALGAGVGLKMTFTLVNVCYEPQQASQKIAYLMLAFAITPGLSVALGGFLTGSWGWMSCFYASAVYGVLLLIMVAKLPEIQQSQDKNALQFKHLVTAYMQQFTNVRLILSGLLMGMSSAFIYVFAAVAPFVAIKLFHLSTEQYGLANCLPPVGLFVGSLMSAAYSKSHRLEDSIRLGISIASFGVLIMFVLTLMNWPLIASLFVPIAIIYFGLCFIMANASVVAMKTVQDKAHGSAVMSFTNMGVATVAVFGLSFFPVQVYLLPSVFLGLCGLMIALYKAMNAS